jgi:hypothetical protein
VLRVLVEFAIISHVKGASGMVRGLRCAAVVGALVWLAACGTTAVEPQNKTLDTRQARVYFLRNTMTIGGVGAEIKVNGQKVGALANSSYFFVDRTPGQYAISVENPLEAGRFATTIQLRAGTTYYVEVEQRPEFLAVNVTVGFVGTLIEQANAPENSGRFKFTLMDQAAGVELLQRLKQ